MHVQRVDPNSVYSLLLTLQSISHNPQIIVMYILFPLLGFLSVSYAIINSVPDPDALNDLCTGLAFATSITDKALSMKHEDTVLDPDPEIHRRRFAVISAFVDISSKFVVGLEQGANFSRAGFVVATDYIYNIEEYLSGELHLDDVKEMVAPLVKRVGKLLENAKEMHTFFGNIQTDLDKVEFDLNDDETYISKRISSIQNKIDDTRMSRDVEVGLAWVLGVLSPAVPPLAPVALTMAGLAVMDNEELDRSIDSRDRLRLSLNDVRHLKIVVENAKRATEAQIQYWSQTLDHLNALEATSQDWLEDPTSKRAAKKTLAQWKVVLKKYSECSHSVSDAGRYIQGRLPLLDQSST